MLEKSAGMNSMMQTDDGDGLQWIGHMNSIAARVASCHELPVERERGGQMREEEDRTKTMTDGWVMWQMCMLSLQKTRELQSLS